MAKKVNGLNTGTAEPEAVNAFMKSLKHPMLDVAKRLRKVILCVDKRIGEGIYWNAPTFYYSGRMKPFALKTYKRYIVGFNLFKRDCVRLIFLRGATVSDPTNLLEGDYKDGRRLAQFHSLGDVKTKGKDLKNIVMQLVTTINE